MLKVLIADALYVFRTGIKEVLFEEFTFVYFNEASDGHSLLEKIKAEKWDIIIVDSEIYDANKEIINQILNLKPKWRILILDNDSPDALYSTEFIDNGSSFIVNKKITTEGLIKAVQITLTGHLSGTY